MIEASSPGCPVELYDCTPVTAPSSIREAEATVVFDISPAETDAIEPVKSFFLISPKAVMTTLSIACAFSLSVTETWVCPAIATVSVSYPMNETTSFPFAGAASEKVPFVPVVVPICWPSTMTVAPATGAPAASVTVPETCLFWADTYNPHTKTAINDSTIFLTISVNFKLILKKKVHKQR